MNNSVWMIAILMAFVAGYGVRGVAAQQQLENTLPPPAVAADATPSSVAINRHAKSDSTIQPTITH